MQLTNLIRCVWKSPGTRGKHSHKEHTHANKKGGEETKGKKSRKAESPP